MANIKIIKTENGKPLILINGEPIASVIPKAKSIELRLDAVDPAELIIVTHVDEIDIDMDAIVDVQEEDHDDKE